MKNILSIILIFLSMSVMAQSKSENLDFVILTSSFDQLEPILQTAKSNRGEGDFQVVLYGEDVKKLESEEIKKYLYWANELKVNISVCKMSLDKLRIDPSSLLKEINIVENAFLYSFQLQKKGYKTLNL